MAGSRGDTTAAAYVQLEEEAQTAHPWFFGNDLMQADITCAVAFRFAREMLPDRLDPVDYPKLAALSEHAEKTDAFLTCQFG